MITTTRLPRLFFFFLLLCGCAQETNAQTVGNTDWMPNMDGPIPVYENTYIRQDTHGSGGVYQDSVYTPHVVQYAVRCEAAFTMFEDSTNNGSWFAFNTSTGNNLSYLWEFGDGGTSTQAYPFHTYTTPGQYIVCLTVSGGACTDTYCDTSYMPRIFNSTDILFLNVVMPSSSAARMAAGHYRSVAVGPNPFEDQLSLFLISDKSTGIELTLYDALGKKILQKTDNCMVGENSFDLDAHEAGKGIYFLVVSDDTGWCKTVKVVK